MPRVPEHAVVSRLANQSHLAMHRHPAEDFGDSFIIIKMLSAGVCGTDLAILGGSRPDLANVLGHEGVGTVLHAPEHAGISPGARVIINPVHRKRPSSVIGHSRGGIFREFFTLDAADVLEGGHLVECPPACSLTDTELALVEPVASVLYSIELLREKSEAGLLLIRGSGTVGVLAAKLWSILTGSPAILVSKSDEHVQWLRDSVRWPSNVRICSITTAAEAIRDYSEYLGAMAAILCCSRESAPEGFCWLLDGVTDGAIIDLMAGFPTDHKETRLGGVRLNEVRWNNICGMSSAPATAARDSSTGKSIYLVGHRGTAERHILQAIELMSRKVISIADIPHRLLTLEQLPGAVKKMLSADTRRHTNWIKAIVDFSQVHRGESDADC